YPEPTIATNRSTFHGRRSSSVACRRASTRARSRRACGRHRPSASNGCGASWSSSRRSSAQVATDIAAGVAAVAHGHVRATGDLDVCYARTEENFERIAEDWGPSDPGCAALRELPFARTIKTGLNFALTIETVTSILWASSRVSGGLRPSRSGCRGARAVASLDVLERNKLAVRRATDMLDIETIAEM